MGVPSVLSNFTSPIVDHALETGARGSTSTTTNYGVIGDAMFKKAQLDLNIANLQADYGLKSASIMGGLQMQKAGLELEKANILNNATLQGYQIKAAAQANQASGAETLLGSIAGIAQGAVAGFAVGGPTGAFIGGAIGGVTTYQGYQQGGRQGGMASQQMLGSIAGAATTLKGAYQQSQAKDAWQGYAKTGADLFAAMNQTQPGSPERYEATQKFESHVASAAGVGASLGMNPQQSAEMVQGIRQSYDYGTNSSDPKKAAYAQMSQNTFEAMGNKDLMDPSSPGHKAARNQFLGQQNRAYSMLTGKDMTTAQAAGELDMVSPGLGSMSFGRRGGGSAQPAQGPSTRIGQPNTSVNNQQAVNPPQQVIQSPQPMSAPVMGTSQNTVGVMAPVAQAPGVQMDMSQRMFSEPVYAEQQLSKQGAEAVAALEQPKEQGLWDKLTTPYKDGEVASAFGVPDKFSKNMAAARGDVSVPQHADGAGPSAISRDWDKEIAETKSAEAQPFFKEMDPRSIQKAFDVKNKYQSADDKSKIQGATAAAAQMNSIRKELGNLKGMDRDILHDYQIWKQGSIGDEGIRGSSYGATGAGFGGQFSNFEKSVRQSLEGKGVKGAAADKQIQILKSIDAQLEPLAQSLAVAKQGSRPSDTDVKAYSNQLANMLDPNPDNSIAGLVTLQQLVYTDFISLLGNTPSRQEYLNQKREEGAAGRMSEAEAMRRKAKPNSSYIFDLN